MFEANGVLKATGGRLLQGDPRVSFKSISMDTRSIKPGEAFIAIKGNNFDGHDFISEAVKKGSSCIIKEKRGSIPKAKKVAVIEVRDTIKALGELAGFVRNKYDIPVIAVTGSNGKTTTKEMIAHVLSGHHKVLKNEGTKNNQIGLPLTLLKLDPSFDFAVLEIGANHFGEVKYLADICRPNIGLITNIGTAHLKHFHNLGGVFREKRALLGSLLYPSIAILNSDDPFLRKELRNGYKKRFALGFGINDHAEFLASNIRSYQNRTEFLVNSKYSFTLKTPGCYNIYNALAAIALGRIFGMGYTEISFRLSAFEFPQGRLKLVKFKKISFIDDTYNANPVSLRQALEALSGFKVKGRKILVMADMLELGRQARSLHRQAGQELAKVCDIFIAVGDLAKLTA
ncbi:MAG: UDP-N-acetylmuramoyl-tripeptide--D-alanyl-D-alanine ligase, partial [bacterium]